MAESAVVVAVAPWALYFSGKEKFDPRAFLVSFLSGFVSALANITRSHAGTPVVLFVAVLLFTFRGSWVKRALLALLLMAGFMLPVSYFHKLVTSRDAVLVKISPGYRPIVAHHPLWHTVYCGLGYLNNDYGLKMQDEFVEGVVLSIRPGVEFLSPEYESILRNEVFRFAKSHPRFIFESLAAKTGMLFIILLVCSNFGLPASVLYKKPRIVETAFWIVLAFTGLQGVLAYPNPDYLLGYIAFAVLYGIVGIDYALSARAGRDHTCRFDIYDFGHAESTRSTRTNPIT